MIPRRPITFCLNFILACCCNVGAIAACQQTQIAETEIADTPGRFGFGWNTQASGIYLPPQARLGQAPLTVEFWVKTDEKQLANVFIAHGMLTSGDHWEIGSRRESGKLYCRFAATKETDFDTNLVVADGQWHYLAAIWNGESIKLFVDDQLVVHQAVHPSHLPVHTAGLALGTRTDQRKLTQIFLDDIRISDQARDIVAAPDLPQQRDQHTLHLWDFEESREDYLARWTPGGETNQPNLPYPHQIAKYEVAGEEDWRDGRWQETMKGPFLSHSFLIDNHSMGAKLSAVFLPEKTTLVFDTKACGFTAALGNSELKINPARFGLLAKPKLEGEVVWHVPPRKTWMKPTSATERVPLESDQIDYRRLSLHGNEVIFHYTVAGVEIAEHGTLEAQPEPQSNPLTVLRRWQIQPSSTELHLTLAEGVEIEAAARDDPNRRALKKLMGNKGQQSLTWSLIDDHSSSTHLAAMGNDAVLVIGPSQSARTIQLAVVRKTVGEELDPNTSDRLAKTFSQLPSMSDLLQPGGRRWGEPLATAGQRAPDDGQASYLIDELTLPFENPFKALFFVSGFDFFPNGDAALCTAHGDVWRVSGIDNELKNLRWQRFATGLYQPLGLRIWNGEVVLICRDQLVRLEDTNQDGEADVYHALNHELHTLGGDHAYAMRLEQDRQGNLYFLKSSEGPPHGASLLCWNRNSKKLEVVASGFRHPYGLGLGPNEELTVADNEGNWVPSSKIDLIDRGKFYGYFEHSSTAPDNTLPARPLCFIPKFIDNSSGGQIWAPADGSWGEYQAGQMLHLSWGRCTLHAVLQQQVDSIWQAATVRFPNLVFRSGSGTGQFHPIDGQLYVVGLDGWQTGAVQDGCFSRVRSTGRTPFMPTSFETYPNGIKVRFSVELDANIAADITRYQLEHWNYRWSSTYGSFHYRPSQPTEIGHDSVSIRGVTLIDPQTIFVHTDPLQVVDQIQLTSNLVASDGRIFSEPILATINAVPGRFEISDPAPASSSNAVAHSPDLFSQENLIAWCVVPFDAAKRGPRERAAMLSELGFKHLAYDWRDEQIPTWDEEVLALRAANINLAAFWAPANSPNPLAEPHWKQILELIDRHQLKMQLWVMLNEGLVQTIPEADRASTAASWLAPVAIALEQRGCQLALYNHGGWSGQPENLIAIVKELRNQGRHNTGIAYNLHHAHDVLSSLEQHLISMRPYLLCLNLNGMRAGGPKILPIGAGDQDQAILSMIQSSGYQGKIGILDHREELDAATALQENLDGLRKLMK